MGKLFGTDGIRGRAGIYPMTPGMALRVGRAVARYFKQGTEIPRIVVGKDTRVSGDMIEHALVAGICAEGGHAFTSGVLPTPGIAFLAKKMAAEAAVVISASHNPYYDNGIKVFRGDGFKLPDDVEKEIESFILEEEGEDDGNGGDNLGRVHVVSDASDQYIAFLQEVVPSRGTFTGMSVVLDCANGATSAVAPAVFRKLGALVHPICHEPNGTNINDQCGSEHLKRLAEAVKSTHAPVGFAFDGDGDRVLCVDETGQRVSGDKMLAICAREMKNRGQLTPNLVVSTVMSNIGLGRALASMDVDHATTQVGDRYVLQEMLKTGARIGSEDSGHMIFLDHHTTGDGIVAALKIAQIIRDTGQPLSALAGVMQVYPQVLMNVDVKEKPPLETLPRISEAIAQVEKALGDEGRVLTRYSGTQPMCRVMVEGPTRELTEKYCRQIVDVVEEELGV